MWFVIAGKKLSKVFLEGFMKIVTKYAKILHFFGLKITNIIMFDIKIRVFGVGENKIKLALCRLEPPKHGKNIGKIYF